MLTVYRHGPCKEDSMNPNPQSSSQASDTPLSPLSKESERETPHQAQERAAGSLHITPALIQQGTIRRQVHSRTRSRRAAPLSRNPTAVAALSFLAGVAAGIILSRTRA